MYWEKPEGLEHHTFFSSPQFLANFSTGKY